MKNIENKKQKKVKRLYISIAEGEKAKFFSLQQQLLVLLCSCLCLIVAMVLFAICGIPLFPVLWISLACLLPFLLCFLFSRLGRDFICLIFLFFSVIFVVLQQNVLYEGLCRNMNHIYTALNTSSAEYNMLYASGDGNYAPIAFIVAFMLLVSTLICYVSDKHNPFDRSNHKQGSHLTIFGKGKLRNSALLMLCGSAIVLLLIAFNIVDTDNAAQKFKARFTDFLYESKVEYTPLPYGNLENFDAPVYTENNVFNITMEMPIPVYLRQFTGSVYSNSVWDYDADMRSCYGLSQWLSYNSLYPAIELGNYLCLLQGAYASNVKMKNIALPSDKFLLPYQTIYTFIDRAEGDTELKAASLLGDREYVFDIAAIHTADMATEDLFTWPLAHEPEADYANAENAYRAFAYENYLNVPEEISQWLLSCFSAHGFELLQQQEQRKVVSVLRRYFTDNFNYSESFAVPVDGEDFLLSFLKNKEGASWHFATLATMLFRSCGIPARYVEGYCLSPDDTYMYESMSDISFDVTDSSAHAWTEIYLDGIGWLPIEVTPTFFRLQADEESTEGIQDILNEDPEYFFIKDVDTVKDPETKPDEEKTEEKEPIALYYKVIFACVMVMLLLLLCWLIIYLHHKRRWAQYKKAECNAAALAMYRHLRLVIGIICGQKVRKALFLREAQNRLKMILPDLPEEQLCSFAELAFKAKFGSKEIAVTAQEREKMYELLQNCSKSLFLSTTMVKKLRMWLHGLNA